MLSTNRSDALSGVIATPKVAHDTQLDKHLYTGKRAFPTELRQAIAKTEKEMTTQNLVHMLANTQLGYLVYEVVGKQLATQSQRVHPDIKNAEGKNVVNQDVILQGIIAQLQTYRNDNSPQ